MSVIEAPTVREVSPVVREVTTADVLNRAADLLEEFGWCQGAYRMDGKFCANGAIGQATLDLYGSYDSEAYIAAANVEGTLTFLGYNDEPGRTKAEVVAKLREAARAA